MYKLNKSNFISLIFISVSFVYAGGSQFGLVNQPLGNIVSPYSAPGVARSYAIAHADSLELNVKNFASWTNISRTTFTINAAYDAIFGENRIQKSFIESANFQGAHLAIPLIKNELIFGAGFQPFTSIEHRVLNNFTNVYDISENTYISGGLSKADFVMAYKFNEQLSLALGYEYTFGKLDHKVISTISTLVQTKVKYNFQNQLNGSGYIVSIFSNPFPKLNAGLMIKPSIKNTLTRSGDTPSEILNQEVNYEVSLPTELNFGLEYNMSDMYNVGCDFVFQDWKKGFKIDNKNVQDYNTYYHLGFGVERKGSRRRFIKYLEQIDYRLGFFYSQLAYLNNHTAVNEIGLSGGFSLPIQRFTSKLDIAGYISKRGDLSKNRLQETIVGIRFSISATETWFVNLED